MSSCAESLSYPGADADGRGRHNHRVDESMLMESITRGYAYDGMLERSIFRMAQTVKLELIEAGI